MLPFVHLENRSSFSLEDMSTELFFLLFKSGFRYIDTMYEVSDTDGTVLGRPVSSEAQVQHRMRHVGRSNAETGVPNHLGMERDDQLYVIGHQPPRNSRPATDENGHAVARVSAGHTYAIPMAAGSSA